jgi:hypothetical protein
LTIEVNNFFIVKVILFLANNKKVGYAKENPGCLFGRADHYSIYPSGQK